MLQTSLKKKSGRIPYAHHCLLQFPHRCTERYRLHRLAAARSRYSIRPAASAEFTIGFPFARLYTEIPSLDCLLVGGIQTPAERCQTRPEEAATAHFIRSSPSLSAGPILTSRYVAPASSCCFALFRIGSGSLSCESLVDDRSGSGKSLANCYKFCHCFSPLKLLFSGSRLDGFRAFLNKQGLLHILQEFYKLNCLSRSYDDLPARHLCFQLTLQDCYLTRDARACGI